MMRNLNIKYLILLFFTILLSVSCSKLETVVIGNRTTSDPNSDLSVAYLQLQVITNQDKSYAMMEHPSDEMLGPTRGSDWDDNGNWRKLHLHTWDAQHTQIRDAWDDLGTGINRGTYAASTAITPQAKGEATFLRAFFMYNVVDLFGKVQYRQIGDALESNPRVISRSQATDTIISDLTKATAVLPKGNKSSFAKATQDAAFFFLAKTYLNKAVFKQDTTKPAGPYNFSVADMNAVIENCNKIISNGNYKLTTPGKYFDNFHWQNNTLSKELIFSIDNAAGNTSKSVRNRYYMTLHYNQQPSSWNGFTTLADFYDSFETGDERLGGAYQGLTDVTGVRSGFLIGQQYDGSGTPLKDRAGNPLVFTKDISVTASNEKQGIRVIKYLPQPGNFDNNPASYIFARFADVLLMKAEALLRGGTDPNGQTALDLVNTLRASRSLTPVGSIDLAGLLAERGHELYWEGWRRNDQIRFGTFLNPDGALVANGRATKSPDHVVVFTIPQRALDANPYLKQNFGY